MEQKWFGKTAITKELPNLLLTLSSSAYINYLNWLKSINQHPLILVEKEPSVRLTIASTSTLASMGPNISGLIIT
jgi:hypothetical protein